MTYDIGSFTEEQKQDWVDYGIIPGPRWNNFDVCSKDCYVCTFEWLDKDKDGKLVEHVSDLYVVQEHVGPFVHQSYLLRSDEEWEGSYGSGPLETLFTIRHKPWTQALHILCGKGQFVWAAIHGTNHMRNVGSVGRY